MKMQTQEELANMVRQYNDVKAALLIMRGGLSDLTPNQQNEINTVLGKLHEVVKEDTNAVHYACSMFIYELTLKRLEIANVQLNSSQPTSKQ